MKGGDTQEWENKTKQKQEWEKYFFFYPKSLTTSLRDNACKGLGNKGWFYI